MIESVTYELIKQEGLREGLEKGLEKGHREGLQEGLEMGLERGRREGLLEGLRLGLDLRFGVEGLRLWPEISAIQDVSVLRAIQEGLKTARSPEELRDIYAE